MMCCYYPTTTLVIDDNTIFLEMLTKHSGIDNCITYSSPTKAMLDASLNKKSPLHRIQSRVTTSINPLMHNDCLPEDQIITFKIRKLHEEIYDACRFQDVAIVIVDYYMDEMNGIEVCEKLIEHPAKKILLTGGIDTEKIAINAFNNGIIHHFINKSDKQFPNKLKQAVAMLKENYFNDLSSQLFPYLAKIPSAIQHQQAYHRLLLNLKNDHNAVEHYMIDATGTLLTLDQNGVPTWCILRHESDMQAYEKLAHDQDAPENIIKGITNRSLIPFFLSDEDYQTPVAGWEPFLYQATPLPGLKNYYYAISKRDDCNHLNQDKIISYSSYQKGFLI